MSLDKIIAISGKPGIYSLKTQTRGGFVTESLLDGKKLSVGARHNVSVPSAEMPLREVFEKIKEKEGGEQAISHKSSKDELEEYFFNLIPDYDEDRVYASDIKKVVQWYNILQKNGIMDFSATSSEEEEE